MTIDGRNNAQTSIFYGQSFGIVDRNDLAIYFESYPANVTITPGETATLPTGVYSIPGFFNEGTMPDQAADCVQLLHSRGFAASDPACIPESSPKVLVFAHESYVSQEDRFAQRISDSAAFCGDVAGWLLPVFTRWSVPHTSPERVRSSPGRWRHLSWFAGHSAGMGAQFGDVRNCRRGDFACLQTPDRRSALRDQSAPGAFCVLGWSGVFSTFAPRSFPDEIERRILSLT